MSFLPPPNPYIAGKALDDERGFFGRQEILREIERSLRREGNSSIVLYGQRRTGKSSSCCNSTASCQFRRLCRFILT